MLTKQRVKTTKRDDLIDITKRVENYLKDIGAESGIVTVFCPHTTAGITINENADPNVKIDMLRRLDELFPWQLMQDLHEEGNTAAHMKSSYVGSSKQVFVHEGELVLGTWQGIYFCEFDGPRDRNLYIKFQKDN